MNTIKTISPSIHFVSENDNVLSTREQGFLRVRPDGTFGAIRRGKCYPIFDVSEDGKTVSVRVDKTLAEAKDDCRAGKIDDLKLPAKPKAPAKAAKTSTTKKPRTAAQQKSTVAMCEERLAKLVADDADEAQIERAVKAVGTAQENLAAMIEHEVVEQAVADAGPVKSVSKMTKAELIAHIASISD